MPQSPNGRNRGIQGLGKSWGRLGPPRRFFPSRSFGAFPPSATLTAALLLPSFPLSLLPSVSARCKRNGGNSKEKKTIMRQSNSTIVPSRRHQSHDQHRPQGPCGLPRKPRESTRVPNLWKGWQTSDGGDMGLWRGTLAPGRPRAAGQIAWPQPQRLTERGSNLLIPRPVAPDAPHQHENHTGGAGQTNTAILISAPIPDQWPASLPLYQGLVARLTTLFFTGIDGWGQSWSQSPGL